MPLRKLHSCSMINSCTWIIGLQQSGVEDLSGTRKVVTHGSVDWTVRSNTKHPSIHILTFETNCYEEAWLHQYTVNWFKLQLHVWQSRVEIEGYSVAYFDRIAVFEVLYFWTSVKGGAHTCFIDAWISDESTKCVWAPPLMEVQWYNASKVAMRLKYTME